MHPLTELSQKIGRTDRSGLPVYGKAKLSPHWYTEYYGPLLEPLRPCLKQFLEIGIGQGGGALLWKHYFPEAEIHAVDTLFREEVEKLLKGEGIHTYYDNAYCETFIRERLEGRRFQVIIDDGAHTLESWVFVLNHYVELLDEGGVLVIEDIQTRGQAEEIIRHFRGDRRRLSLVDRRLLEDSAINEMLLVYS